MSKVRIAYILLAAVAVLVAAFGAFVLYRQFFVVNPALRPSVQTVVTQEQLGLVDILDQSSQNFDASAGAQSGRADLLKQLSGGQASSSTGAPAPQTDGATQEDRADLLKSLGR